MRRLQTVPVSILVVALCSCAIPHRGSAQDEGSDALVLLAVRGTSFVDEDGRAVALRGTNLGNWLLLEMWMMNQRGEGIYDQYRMERVLADRFGEGEKDRLMALYRDHWIAETGFTFPSGHSLTAMTLATFFAAVGLALLRGPRLWVVLLLVPWAVLVCYSRVALRVHRPVDVLCGALAGILIGALAFVLLRPYISAKPASR